MDATKEDGRLGRLINHSRKASNLSVMLHISKCIPRICFYAAKDIQEGCELQYDYGEKAKPIIAMHPWLEK